MNKLILLLIGLLLSTTSQIRGFPNFTYEDNPTLKVISNDSKESIDTLVLDIIQEIKVDSVRSLMKKMEDFNTRYMFAGTRDSLVSWLYFRFKAIGIVDVIIDSFLCHNTWPRDTITWQKNVIATIPGIYYPEKNIVVGGHYDSFSYGDPLTSAPGADDNASGTAAVLEIARVLKQKNFQPKFTIRFVAFGAEELMLSGYSGCEYFAEKAKSTGMDIQLMVNHDMISYTSFATSDYKLKINYYSGFESLFSQAEYFTKKYTFLKPIKGTQNQASDSYPFWQQGYPAIYFEEFDRSPFCHTTSDLVVNYNLEYCVEVIRASCAMLVSLQAMPTVVCGLEINDMGGGNSLLIKWRPNPEPDISYYKIYVGTQPSVYDTSYRAMDSIYILRNLSHGTEYYIGISVVNNKGYESLIDEKTGTPYIIPASPQNLVAEALWHAVELRWKRNSECDLLGYNVYKIIEPQEPPVKINSEVVLDTFFTDYQSAADKYQYYFVTALDSTFYESQISDKVRSRAVSLQFGVLIVDETVDGDGTLMFPNDFQVDSFYTDITQGFSIHHYDLATENKIDISDLGAFSTVIWHGNDFSELNSLKLYRDEIKKYLNYGGKLLLTTYQPAKAFLGIITYPNDFSTGSFLYDYLGIRRVEYTPMSRFNGARSIDQCYPSIYVDTLKILSSYNNHLINIEAIYGNPNAQNIYSYETNYDSTTFPGRMKGRPVGIEYLSNDYKVVTISFPLYYMNLSEAKELVRHILISKFSEPDDVRELKNIPINLYLAQNYPNPFNPQTTIRYDLPKTTRVTIEIYDLLGHKVKTLVDEKKTAGSYTTTWNGTTEKGLTAASGIYFYRIKTDIFSNAKKMILMR